MIMQLNAVLKKSDLPVFVCGRRGEFHGLYQKAKSGLWHGLDPEIRDGMTGRCILAVPPGMAAIRYLALEGGSKKTVGQALEMEAQATLFLPPDHGFGATSFLAFEDKTRGCLAWMEKGVLENCRATAEKMGFRVSGLLIPELCLKRGTPSLLCYEREGIRAVFYASGNGMNLAQTAMTQGPGPLPLITELMGQVAEEGAQIPGQAFIWAEDSEKEQVWESGLHRSDIRQPPIVIRSWADILPYLDPGALGGKSFKAFIHYQDARKLDGKETLKLSGLVCLTLICIGLFLGAYFIQTEREMIQFRKTVSTTTRAAKKSARATQLIREIQEKVALLRKFTEDKPYRLALVRDITSAGSGKSRLDSIAITQAGSISIQGVSKDELYITSMVKKLEESPLIMDCRLNGMENDPENKVLRFSIQARVEKWQDFFDREAQ